MIKIKILEHQTNENLTDKVKKKFSGTTIDYSIHNLIETKPIDEVFFY